ncbi:10041_t:CDS:1, partial [Ambispora gerdemannii]
GKAIGHAQTYYSDGINKTGILCSKCHQEQLKEQAEERKKDQE